MDEIWSTITLCGKLRGDQIMLETVGRYQKTPAFPTFFSGTVNGEKMELKYSGPYVPDGTISLEFIPSQPN